MIHYFPPQEQVINSGLLYRDEHCFLDMATGSGKTFLAELAIENVIKAGYKVIYVTPLRALAAQQKECWDKRFPQHIIGIFTGDTTQQSCTKGNYKKSDILIMTPERLDACMRNWRSHWNWIPDVSLVIIDEFHILGQPSRGSRLEGTITRLIRLNPFLRIIGLSATIPNAPDLSNWLCGSYFSSKWRQIPLEKRIIRFKSAKEKPKLLLHEVSRCIQSGGQSLIFCNSRSIVQNMAAYLKDNGISVAAHHAGLIQEKRKQVEATFRSREIKALVSTSTLEMGLNLPARQVIIYDSYSYTDRGFVPLPVWSFIQRAGRAGRPGMDDKGEVVLFLSRWAERPDKYLHENCEPVQSQLTNTRDMQEQILIDVFSGFSRTREELTYGFLPLTYYKHQHEEANIQGLINKLYLADLLQEAHPDNDNNTVILKVGLLGRLAVKLMFSPSTVKMISTCYQKAPKLYFFDLLFIAALSEDCSPVLQANYEEMDTLCEIIQQQPSSMLNLNIEHIKKLLTDCPGTLRILAAIKMSAICLCLIQDKPLDEIASTFDVFESDILMLKENMVRLIAGETAIISAIDKHEMGEEQAKEHHKEPNAAANISSTLVNMLHYQITNEHVSLTKLDGVGGKTAKLLARNNYHTLQAIAQSTSEQLSSIKGIGKKLSGKMIIQAKKLIIEHNTEPYTENLLTPETKSTYIQTNIDPYRLRRSLELSIKRKENDHFIITGGREDHIVQCNINQFHCDCLDYAKRQEDCKHILCVKRTLNDPVILKMIKHIKEDKNHSIRESLPSLWYSVTAKELNEQ